MDELFDVAVVAEEQEQTEGAGEEGVAGECEEGIFLAGEEAVESAEETDEELDT